MVSEFFKADMLIFFSLLCIFLVAEVAVRILEPGEVIALDNTYLHKLIPGSHTAFKLTALDGGGSIKVSVNSLGFRGSDFPIEKKGKRIVVYGDSFIEAQFSNLDNTFPQQLERDLGQPVEVINGGVIAYGPDQESLRIDHEIGLLKPDLIIVGIYTDNDYGDLMRDKIYRLSPNGTLMLNSYYLDPKTKLLKKLTSISHSLRVLINLVNKAVINIRKSSTNIDYNQLQYNRDLADCVSYQQGNKVTNLFDDGSEAGMFVAPGSECSLYKQRLMKAVLSHMRDTAAAHNVSFMLLLIPSKYEVSPGARLFNYAGQFDLKGYNRTLVIDELSGTAASLNISYLSLYDVFAGNASYYFVYDGHWNDLGQELAANVTAGKIMREHLLGS
jgi:hypothetical protein